MLGGSPVQLQCLKNHREYYHQKLAPSSDVDIFIYGLNEEAAIQKMQQIETKIRDGILQETTVGVICCYDKDSADT